MLKAVREFCKDHRFGLSIMYLSIINGIGICYYVYWTYEKLKRFIETTVRYYV